MDNNEKKKGLGAKIIILIVIAALILFFALIGFITDFLWFRELSYVSVFLTKLLTQIKLAVPVFIVITALAYLYLNMLKRGYCKKVASTAKPREKFLKVTAWLLAIGSGIVVTFSVVTKIWWSYLQFTNSTNFNIDDPLFKNDIAFYIFKLDFIKELNDLVIGAVIVFAIITVVYYMLLLGARKPQVFEEKEESYSESYDYSENQNQGAQNNPFGNGMGGFGDLFGKFMGGGQGPTNQNFGSRRSTSSGTTLDKDNLKQLVGIASKQLIVLGVIFFLMLGVNFFLKQYELLYSSTGVLYGAGFTDVNITLWVYRILIALSVIAAITFAIGMTKRKFKTVLTVPVIMIAVGLLGSGLGLLVQNFVVSPDAINKESIYLGRNIEYTQYAYGLDDVETRDFSASNKLTLEDIELNKETINNIRINDYEPTEKFYNQTQAIRQYYTFTDTDVDRYMVNGEYTQVFLSAREIDESKISQEWLNVHLKYTHGYGITLSRVDQITSSGQPDMLIDSIPPVSQISEIGIEHPEIYFGELTNSYILVKTDEEEFDYPDGSSNVYTFYDGTAGIKLNPINRLMFSIREHSLKLLVSTNIDGDSRIVINRNIVDRVKTIMPYLSYDSDPYIVTVDGKLYWIIDAYTVSDNYPYSEPFDTYSGSNYIRNSVKVVIDAYNGTTDYYIVDDNDPMAKTMQKIFPALFKDFDEMPASLQAHIRYPDTLFMIQANIYSRYHMEDVKVFYQSEDLWDISNEIYGLTEQQMSSNYYIMKLPGEDKEEFVNTIPYTPRDKDNMISLLVARNDGANYGELVLYQLPKSKIVYGPMQIEAQIDQNTEISKEFSLWNSSGSTYTRGNMFVIPIEDSFIYVEPVYLEASNSAIPEVKRVIVAYNDQIAYQPTLAEALVSLFGENPPETDDPEITEPIDEPPAPPAVDIDFDSLTEAQLITGANEAFMNAQTAQQSGDWAAYGEYLNILSGYLNKLAEVSAAAEAEAGEEAAE